MVKYMSQAKMLFKKLSSPGTPSVQSVASGQYFFQWVNLMFFKWKYLLSYLVKNAVCVLCLCDQNFARKAAFAYLEDVANEFLSQHGTQIESVTRPYHFLEFGCGINYYEIYFYFLDTHIQNIKRKHMDKGRNGSPFFSF